MKPTEPDIKWCIENADFVNGLLEKRGGWQDGDSVYTEDTELSDCVEGGIVTSLKEDGEGGFVTQIGTSFGRSTDYAEQIYTCGGSADEITQKCIWLPSVDDVLAMLKLDYLTLWKDGADVCVTDADTDAEGRGKTRFIAFMELLKLCDSIAS